MKKQSFLVMVVVSFLIMIIFSFTTNSYGQFSDPENSIFSKNEVFIFVQTIVENSDDQIVTYLTSDKFSDLNVRDLDTLLDSEITENDQIITINGQKYQVIKRKLTINYDKENVIASTLLAHTINDKLTIVARFAHDGYPIVSGDKVQSIWTFLRPVE